MKYLYHGFFYIILAVFIALGATAIFGEKTEYSENENRYLSQFPSISYEGIRDGEVQEGLTSAMNDQMLGRDFWIKTTTSVEKTVGLKEAGGVYLGKDHYYFEKIMDHNISQTKYFQNLRFVKQLYKICSKSDVVTMLVPSPGTILEEKLPAHAKLYDADTMYKEAVHVLGKSHVLDLRERLGKASEEKQVYYRTDHHWTLYGAYQGYAAYAEKEKQTVEGWNAFAPQKITDSFFGTLYSKALDRDARPDEMMAATKFPALEVTCDGRKAELYDRDKLSEKDKYAYFFGGNFATVNIKNKDWSSSKSKKLLVIKDSFANSMVPFLTKDFEDISMIDLRYFKESPEKFIQEYNPDQILVLYEMSNFAGEEHLKRLMN